MSRREDHLLSLAGVDISAKSNEELITYFNTVLKSGTHGLCFSPYLDGQAPGSQLSEEQIRSRIEIVKPYTKWIRSFSCTEGNELIPVIAKEYGLKTLVGAWLGKDKDINEQEINNLIQLTNDGYADVPPHGQPKLFISASI